MNKTLKYILISLAVIVPVGSAGYFAFMKLMYPKFIIKKTADGSKIYVEVRAMGESAALDVNKTESMTSNGTLGKLFGMQYLYSIESRANNAVTAKIFIQKKNEPKPTTPIASVTEKFVAGPSNQFTQSM